MKAKQFLLIMVAFCGLTTFAIPKVSAQVLSNNQSERTQLIDDPVPVVIGVVGLKYGYVSLLVSNNGKSFYFSSETMGSIPGYIGEFNMEGNSFEVEVTPLNISSLPNYSVVSSPNLSIEKLADNKYRFSKYEPDEHIRVAEISFHFD